MTQWDGIFYLTVAMRRDHGERSQALEHVGRGEGRDRGMGERHLLFNCRYGTGSWRMEAGFRARGTGRGKGQGDGGTAPFI